MSATPKKLGTTALALRLVALRETTAYVVYLIHPAVMKTVEAELRAELAAYDEGLNIRTIESSPSSARLLQEAPSILADVLLIGADAYAEADWRLLDRRRSEFSREGITVFLTSPGSFAMLMRVAPNLASWLGGSVFTYEDIDALAIEQRDRRLASLRTWSGKTDGEVLQAAQAGRLPRDPEFAEWLVLLGRGDLLNA